MDKWTEQPSHPIVPLISEYMRRHGLTRVTDFASHAGIGRALVYDLIKPKPGSYPSVPTLMALARTLGKETHELLYLFAPDAPGAPGQETATPQEAAAARLRHLGEQLPEVDAFLQTRRESA